MNLNDIFGINKHRPDHPDFWKLSSIILDMDGAMEEGVARGEQPDDILARKVSEVGDTHSLTYMATQRAFRVLGVETGHDLREKAEEVITVATIYLEGMVVGARFRDEGEDGDEDEK